MPEKETSVETPKSVETPEIEEIMTDNSVETPDEVETPEIDSLDYKSMYDEEHQKYVDLINKHNEVVRLYNERFMGKSNTPSSIPSPQLPENLEQEDNITIDELLFGKDD